MKREELHDILYDILCEIDDACKKENVPYFLTDGTLLGAIRHQGFIPWDDDVDIAIWKKDYQAIRNALRKHLPEHMRLVEPEDLSPNFYDFVARVQDTRYHWHEPTEEDVQFDNLQNYICVDIFMLVECSNSVFGIKLYALLHKILYGMAMAHRPGIDFAKYSLIQKLQVRVLSLLGKAFKMNTIHKMYHNLCDRKAVPRKYAFCVNTLTRTMGIPIESAWHRNTEERQFRDREFPVPVGYHEKLTAYYGDYMKPPKDRSRYIQHVDFEDENGADS